MFSFSKQKTSFFPESTSKCEYSELVDIEEIGDVGMESKELENRTNANEGYADAVQTSKIPKQATIEQLHDEDGNSTRWYSVDTYMLPAKLAYFVNGASGGITSYFMLFYVSSGISPSEAGLLNGLQYLGAMIINPIWGVLADKFGFHQLITTILCVVAISAACIQPYLSATFSNEYYNSCPLNNKTAHSNLTLSVSYNAYEGYTTDKRLLYFLLISAIVFASFDGGIAGFIDAAVLQRVQASPHGDIGKQQYAGSVGVALGSIAYSLSIYYFPTGNISCYAGIFITYTVFAICTGVCCLFLYRGISIPREERRENNVVKLLIDHLKQYDTLFFLFNVLFTGILQALLFSFLFLFLKELNAPTLLFGFSIALNSVSAVTTYVLSTKIITFVGGPMEAIAVSCFAWAVRFLCTAFLINPFLVLVLDIFHGFTFSLSRVAALQYVEETSNATIFTSMCTINNILFNSCGFLISNIAGGKLYDTFGPKRLFIGTSVVCFVWGFVIVLYMCFRGFGLSKINPRPGSDDNN